MGISESERSFRVVISCLTCIFVAILFAISFREWSEFRTNKAAIEAGYSQQIVEGKTIWVKERDNGH